MTSRAITSLDMANVVGQIAGLAQAPLGTEPVQLVCSLGVLTVTLHANHSHNRVVLERMRVAMERVS